MELTSMNDRMTAASNDLSLLVKQKAENDEFYNKKIEVECLKRDLRIAIRSGEGWYLSESCGYGSEENKTGV